MGTNFPFASIGDMPVMAFWVRSAEHLTLAPDDLEAALRVKIPDLPEEQRQRLHFAIAFAQDRLLHADIGLPYCGKPS